MIWTREKDLELVVSFASGEMHNFFVFCRRHEVMVPDAFARGDELKADKKHYQELLAAARQIVKDRKAQWDENAEQIKKMIAKGSVTPTEREFLANHEWVGV
jgi:hypothetical protein